MQDDVKNSEIKQTDNLSKISEKRRKLIKASAAVPLVATLTTGVAQANSSAFQCLDKNTNPQPAIVGNEFKDSEDAAVRAKVKIYEKDNVNDIFKIGSDYFFEDGTDVTSSINDGTIDLNYYASKDVYVLKVFKSIDDGTNVKRIGRWPKKQFTGTRQPLFQSCWTSLTTASIGSIKGNVV